MLKFLKRIYTSLSFRIITILLVIMLVLGFMFSKGVVGAIMAVVYSGDFNADEESLVVVLKAIVYFISGFVFLLLSLAIILIVNWQIKPLRKIAEAADAVSMGDFQAELPTVWANTEIRRLRNSFYCMQQRLIAYVEDLKETTHQNAVLEHDVAVAADIQKAMLPKSILEHEKFDIYGIQQPARLVGGDLYDFFLHDGKLFFCIGDVSGKGVPAALFMTVVIHLFRNVGRHTDNPAEIAGAINQELADGNEKNMFCTLFIGVLDIETRKLQFCNAGHNTPIFIHENSVSFMQIDADIPAGAYADFDYQMQEIQLEKNDAFFFYTDGVTEATDVNGHYFGESATLASVITCPLGCSMKELTLHMLESVVKFVGEAEQNDDITILTLRV